MILVLSKLATEGTEMPDTNTIENRSNANGSARLSPAQLAAIVKAAYILDAVRR